MAPKKKDHSNNHRSLVIKHYQNEDSQREVSTKVLLPRETIRYIIRRYKETKCIGNVSGRVRKRKTSAATDRLIICKIKSNRRLSVHKVKTEFESELRISLNVNTNPSRVHEAGISCSAEITISQQGQLGKAVKVRKKNTEQISWVLGNSNLVR